jgi:hypothetical protein
MKKTIKFRGKIGDYIIGDFKIMVGEWVYGDLVQYEDCVAIRSHHEDYFGIEFQIEPESAGFTTYYVDKNLNAVYTKDIVKCFMNNEEVGNYDVIEFKEGAYWLRYRDIPLWSWVNRFNGEIEVVGNLTDNRELVQGHLMNDCC